MLPLTRRKSISSENIEFLEIREMHRKYKRQSCRLAFTSKISTSNSVAECTKLAPRPSAAASSIDSQGREANWHKINRAPLPVISASQKIIRPCSVIPAPDLSFKVKVNVCDTKFGFRPLKAEQLKECR